MDFFDNIIDQIRDRKPGGNDAPVTWYGIPENLRNAVDVPGMESPKESETLQGQPNPEPSSPDVPEDGSDAMPL